jgi:hypothetical protein
MLTRVHKILIGLLAVQLALAALLLLRDGEPQVVKDTPLLATLDAAKVTRVRLYGAGAEQPGVDLVRKGSGWVVASHSDYPADPAKVTGLIEPLAKVAAGEPIATSPTRHKQLRVGDREFERKLVLDVEGAGERTIVIGIPVGGRRTAIRIGGDEVYAATEVSQFVAEPAGFVSTRYVDVPKAEVERLAIRRDEKMIELARVAEAPAAGAGSAAAPAAAWQVTIDGVALSPAAGESLDTDAIDRLAAQAASIDLKTPADPKRDASKPTATITIHKKGVADGTILDVIADGESYWIRQRGLDRAILVDKSTLADVVLADRDKLVKKPPAPGAGAGAGEDAGAMPGLPPGMQLPPDFQLPPAP